jgi:hypothetical protein
MAMIDYSWREVYDIAERDSIPFSLQRVGQLATVLGDREYELLTIGVPPIWGPYPQAETSTSLAVIRKAAFLE